MIFLLLLLLLLLLFCYNQKTTAEGKDYCDRKINLLRSNFDQLVEVCSDSPFLFPLEPCVVAFNSGCKSVVGS